MNRTWMHTGAMMLCCLSCACQAHDTADDAAKPPAPCCLASKTLTTGPLSEVAKDDLPPNVAMSGQGNSLALKGPKRPTESVHDDGPLMTTTACSEDDVARVILQGRDAVRACAQKHAPNTPGAFETRWELSDKATPENVSAYSDDDALSAASACVKAVIEGWRFTPLPPDSYCEVLKTFKIDG